MPEIKFTQAIQSVAVKGQTLHVREMDGHGFGKFLAAAKDRGYEAALVLLQYTVCEADGTLVFPTLEDVGQLPKSVVDVLSEAASKLNVLGEDADATKSPAA